MPARKINSVGAPEFRNPMRRLGRQLPLTGGILDHYNRDIGAALATPRSGLISLHDRSEEAVSIVLPEPAPGSAD